MVHYYQQRGLALFVSRAHVFGCQIEASGLSRHLLEIVRFVDYHDRVVPTNGVGDGSANGGVLRVRLNAIRVRVRVRVRDRMNAMDECESRISGG